MTKKLWMVTMTVLALAGGGVALADGDGPPPPPHHHRPPAEAFTACASLSEGATCTVTFHDKTHDGTCRKAPAQSEDAGKLFCAPPHPPGPPPHESEGPQQ